MKRHLSATLAWLKACPHARRPIVILTFCALMGVSAHVLYLRFLPAPWLAARSADFRTYYGPVAERLAKGKGLSVPSGKPAVRYPPAIPLLYGATFWTADKLHLSDAAGIRVLQGTLVVIGTMLVAAITFAVFPFRIALMASLLWSTYPLQLWLTKQPSGMNVVGVLLLLSVFLFLRWSKRGNNTLLYGVAVGASLALITLSKPFGVALPAVFILLACFCWIPGHWRKRVVFSSCVVLVYILMIVPWEVWAFRATGRWIPLCTDGPSAMVDGLSFGLVRHNKTTLPLPADVSSVALDFATHARQMKNSELALGFLVGEARQRPAGVAHLFLIKSVRAWYGNDSHTHEKWVVLIQLFYLPFIVLGGRLSWNRGGWRRNFLLVAGALTLYYWAMTTLAALAIVRYMIPATPLLMILAGTGVEACLQYCRTGLALRFRPQLQFAVVESRVVSPQ